ncbi:MAG: DUF2877 domain-containing protein [Nitrospira sp.]|nr:DUF2877 domain-containing protein [Nitrospira sp.]
MRLPALSAGIEAPTDRFTGVIHSVFRGACNIRLADGNLLTLLSPRHRDVPNGLRLATPSPFDFSNLVRTGQAVACRGGILRIAGSDLSADLRCANRRHIDLACLRIDLHRAAHAAAWALARRTLETEGQGDMRVLVGLAVVRAEKNCVTRIGLSAPARRVLELIPPLLHATHTLQLEQAAIPLERLIGLGPGLTPAGDDFLVGYMTGLWSCTGGNVFRLQFLASLGARLAEAAMGTNEISRAYIHSAIKGHSAEPLASLARQLDHPTGAGHVRAATQANLEIGHSSGTDAVAGLLAGCIPWAGPSSEG